MSNKQNTELLKRGIIPEGMDAESGARAVAYWQRKEAGRIQAENNTRWGRLANRGEVCDDMPNDYRIRAKEVNELRQKNEEKTNLLNRMGQAFYQKTAFMREVLDVCPFEASVQNVQFYVDSGVRFKIGFESTGHYNFQDMKKLEEDLKVQFGKVSTEVVRSPCVCCSDTFEVEIECSYSLQDLGLQ